MDLVALLETNITIYDCTFKNSFANSESALLNLITLKATSTWINISDCVFKDIYSKGDSGIFHIDSKKNVNIFFKNCHISNVLA